MSRTYSQKKIEYSAKLTKCLQEYRAILIVEADNVGSNQLQLIRTALRGKAEIIMGKNTQIRRVIRTLIEDYPDLSKLVPLINGNCGLVFTDDNIKDVRDVLVSFRVPAAAKAGSIAPDDVFVPPGTTGMDPGQTAFFQSLGIATKIVKGSIEIVSEVHLIKKGNKVGNSETALLSKLGIKPFSYGLTVVQIYDMGAVYTPFILDISYNDLIQKFFAGVNRVAAVSLAIGYPTLASVPHSMRNALKNLIAIAVETNFSFKEAEAAKAYLANPDAFRAAAPAAGGAAAAAGGDAAPAAADDDDDDDADIGGGGLFGDAESDEEEEDDD